MSGTIIRQVEISSPAARAGMMVGETLLTVNGHNIVDVLDYKFYTYDPKLSITLRTADGDIRTLSLKKREGEDLGLEFEVYLMDNARSCANDCIFCFVDQLPCGMRETLYFKDDDARLSFLMGNYITLTNLSEREIQRIIDLRVSPVNISVHTTNRALRNQMLGRPNAGRGIDIMERLAEANITMNCQIVACPDINDGKELDRTMDDLLKMHPAVNSVSVVPIGVTKFRDGLYPLRPYTSDEAERLITQVESFGEVCRKTIGTSLVWCSDEFYLSAGRNIPEEEYFEEFTQLDNGVGMLRLLQEEFRRGLDLLDEDEMSETTPFSIATGLSAAPLLGKLVDMAGGKCDKIEGIVYPIRNDFFGETITVAGLVTGGDLIAQLKDRTLGERLLIPSSMLRSGEQVFLDDVSLEDVSSALGIPVMPVEQDGYELCDAIFGIATSSTAHHVNPPEDEYYQYNQSN